MLRVSRGVASRRDAIMDSLPPTGATTPSEEAGERGEAGQNRLVHYSGGSSPAETSHGAVKTGGLAPAHRNIAPTGVCTLRVYSV